MGRWYSARTSSGSAVGAERRQRPAAGRRAVEAEQEHALPPSEAQLRVPERDLLRAWAEQQPNEPFALRNLRRDEPLEQVLEVLEEPGFALVDADDAGRLRRRHVG